MEKKKGPASKHMLINPLCKYIAKNRISQQKPDEKTSAKEGFVFKIEEIEDERCFVKNSTVYNSIKKVPYRSRIQNPVFFTPRKVIKGGCEKISATPSTSTDNYSLAVSEEIKIPVSAGKIRKPSSSFVPKEMSSRYFNSHFIKDKCTCGRSVDLPCCKMAEKWLSQIYGRRGQKFNYDKSAKAYSIKCD